MTPTYIVVLATGAVSVAGLLAGAAIVALALWIIERRNR